MKPCNATLAVVRTHRHQDLSALAEQYGVLQRAVGDGAEGAVAGWQAGQVQVEVALDLAEGQHVVAAEGGAHKVLQLRAGRRMAVLGVGPGGGARVAVQGAVGKGVRGVHGLLRVAQGLLLDADGGRRSGGVGGGGTSAGLGGGAFAAGVQVPLQRGLVVTGAVPCRLQTLLTTHVDWV